MADPYAQAKAILAQAFTVEPQDIPEDASLKNFDPWDSMGHLQVLMASEEWLGVPLGTEATLEIVDLQSLQSVLRKSKSNG